MTMTMAPSDDASNSSTGGLAGRKPSLSFRDGDDLTVMSDEDEFGFSTSPRTKATTKASVTSTLSHPIHTPSNSSHEDLALEKLQISDLGLFGRDKEIGTLNTCLEKVVSRDVERQLLMISGVSGTGKSALANSLMDSVKQHNGLFVRGKFDLHLHNEPYTGIASACAEICGHIQALQVQDPPLFDQVCDRIKQELGPELVLLNQVISVLGEIIDPPSEDDTSIAAATAAASSSAEAKNRFQFAFQRFIRVISDQFSPFVMVLDDLHWADRASLELLDALVSDRGNSGIMIIGIYRSNEVDETQAFHDVMDEFQFKIHDNIFEMTEVFIDDLDMTAVHEIVQTLLLMEGNAKSQSLAQVCFEKTNGNAFFLVHFLLTLHESGLLKYDSETLSWDWDEEEIENNTKASANVVEMLKAKMSAQPDHNMNVLKAAACLGCTFEEQNLRLVCKAMTAKPSHAGNHKNSVTRALQSLEKDGYIKKHSEATYVWTHDKIQEAALALIPDRRGFSHRIGEILLSGLGEEDLESAIFVVANLLNCGDMTDNDKKLKLAHINRDASRKAVSLCAFESAADFAGKGINLLPPTRWTDEHYSLSLELFSIGAQAEGCLGNIEKMDKYCQEVLAQDDRPLEDKLSVYNTWIDSILNRGKTAGAAELLLHLLEKFDCRFPKNSLSVGLGIVSNLVRIKTRMKSLQTVEHDEMTDSTKTELMKLLDKLTTCLYMEKDDRMPLVVFRSLKWTNSFGFCDHSPASYAATGVMLTGILNDIQGGSMYGEKALELVEKSPSSVCAARAMFIVNNFLFSWTKPMGQLVQPLMHAYEIGLQSGDAESGLWGAHASLMMRFITGDSLEQLEPDFRMHGNQMKDLKRYQHLRTTRNMHQVVLNLLGRNEDGPATKLVGEVCSQKDLDKHKDDPFHFVSMSSWQGVLWTYFGEHERHADMAIELGSDCMIKAHVASPAIAFDSYLKGVSCFAASRQTGRRRYARMAEKMRAKVKKWKSLGNPNVKHYSLILDAEHCAAKGHKSRVVKLFEEAISVATESSFLHDAALASERLAEFQLRVLKNKDEAALWIAEASECWRRWGAVAKVGSLEHKYSQLLPQPAEVVTIASTATKTETINTLGRRRSSNGNS